MSEEKYFDWVKRLGQWHFAEMGKGVTLCGRPMLGNNYADMIEIEERKMCKDCWEQANA